MANWLDDPAVAHIDKTKLDFLQMLVFESNGLSKEQMLPFLMAVAKRSKESNISFTEEEMNTIIDTLRKYSSPEEIDKMNKMINIFRNRR
ncbi:MAG: hypothetical protein PUD93_07295 [Lachnospiraceae bacterium]|nr:hypothetical protein [Lachnospiraceae bacterium]